MGSEQSKVNSNEMLSFSGYPPKWLLKILEFQSPSDQRNTISLNREFASFTHTDMFARHLCLCLKYSGVYVPAQLPLSERNWKSFYKELAQLRDMWVNDNEEKTQEEQEELLLLTYKGVMALSPSATQLSVKRWNPATVHCF